MGAAPGAATVVFVVNTTSIDMLLNRLCASPEFQDPHRRTVTRVAEWLGRQRATSTTLRTAVDENAWATAAEDHHSCATAPACPHLRERLANTLLRKSGTLPVSHVTDFPSAAILIASRAAGRILSDEVLAEVLDTSPGGARFGTQVGYDAIRWWLRSNPHIGCDPGLPELDEFMGGKVGDGALDAAHRIWRAGNAHWASVGGWAVSANLSDKEAAHIANFWAVLAVEKSSTDAMYVPSPAKFAAALGAYHSARVATQTPLLGATQAHLDDLLCVFAPTQHSMQAYRGFLGRQLRDVMWQRVAACSELPFDGNEPYDNLARITDRCGVEPTAAELRAYPRLARLCGEAARPGIRTRSTATGGVVDVDDAGLRTLADARNHIVDRVDDKGRLPARASFDQAVLDRIEKLFALPYTLIVESLVAECGYKAPGRSRNEVAFDQIVDTAFGPIIRERHVEWTDATWRATSGAYRVDTRYVLADPANGQLFDTGDGDWELHCEADGQGHFERVRNWNLDECRLRDQAKTRVLAERRAQVDFDVTFVAVHWRSLTGPAACRLDADTFTSIVTALRAVDDRWWAFICPAGETDRRAVPTGCRLERLAGDWDDTVWVWTLVGDPTTKA